MKVFGSHTIEALLVSVAIVVLGLCIKGGIDNFVDKDRQVTVKGLSEMEVKADKATWSISVSSTGNDVKLLYADVMKDVDKVKNFLTSNGLNENDIVVNSPYINDLHQGYYSIENRPEYRYDITINLNILTKDVDLVRSLASKRGELINEGLLVNDYVSYDYTSFKSIKSKMMDEAIANAQKTAQQFAKTSGSKLNKIMNADQGQFSVDDRDENSPYIKKLRVVTTITYSLKD